MGVEFIFFLQSYCELINGAGLFFFYDIGDYFGDSLKLLWNVEEWSPIINGTDNYSGDFEVLYYGVIC